MKTHLLALLFLGLALVAPAPVRADDPEASFDYFHDSLAPYGEWIQAGDYGLCWHPNGVPDDWAPYTDGYWSYTDAGWTWVSYEDFGGIVYHYGRWVTVPDEGWCWVPDYQWGPAWVSWRNNDNYVGWAPLPPEAEFTQDVGISTWVDTSYDIGPGYYRFCRVEDFGAPVLTEVLLPRARSVIIIGDTFNVTNITFNPLGFPFAGGPRFDFIASRALRPVPTLKLVQITNLNNVFINKDGRRTLIMSQQRGNTLVLPAVRVRRPTPAALAVFKPAKVLAVRTGAPHGWDIVKNHDEAEKLHATFRDQVKGATPATAHARPFQAAEVKVVPVKADPKAVIAARPRPVTEPGRTEPLKPAPGVVNTEKPPLEKHGGFVAPGAQPGAQSGAQPERGPNVPKTAIGGEGVPEKHGGFAAPGTNPADGKVRRPGDQPGAINFEEAEKAARERSAQRQQMQQQQLQQEREAGAAQAGKKEAGAEKAARAESAGKGEGAPQMREANEAKAAEAAQAKEANQARAMDQQRKLAEEQQQRAAEARRAQQEQAQRQQQIEKPRPQQPQAQGGGKRPLTKEELEALKKQQQ